MTLRSFSGPCWNCREWPPGRAEICSYCWQGNPTAAELAALADRVRSETGEEERFLATVVDPALRSDIAALCGDGSTPVRRAAIASMAWMGPAGHADVARVAQSLGHGDRRTRASARYTLGRIGGVSGADALFAALPSVDDPTERGEVITALAALGDLRALEPANELWQAGVAYNHAQGEPPVLDQDLGRDIARPADAKTPERRIQLARDYGWLALGFLGLEAALASIIEHHARLPGAYGPLYAAAQVCGPAASERLSAQLAAMRPRPPVWVDDAEEVSEPPEGTVACSWFSGQVHDAPPDDRHPTKFGGQPDWRSTPAWPVSATGIPFVFYGQFALRGPDGDVTAYFFYDPDGAHWQPLGPANALVTQPGPLPDHVRTVRAATGPCLYDIRFIGAGPADGYAPLWRTVAVPLERWPVLVDGSEPAAWPLDADGYDLEYPHEYERQRWNKIGGTPTFLQGPEMPAGEGWKYAFQFSADPDIADGAECTGFLHEDGSGALLWQCH